MFVETRLFPVVISYSSVDKLLVRRKNSVSEGILNLNCSERQRRLHELTESRPAALCTDLIFFKRVKSWY